MQWQEIRKHYPEQWLLVEAVEAHSDAGKRILVFSLALTNIRVCNRSTSRSGITDKRTTY